MNETTPRRPRPIYRVVLQGNPMSGKTTFLRKVAYDWAQTVTTLDENANSRTSILSKYKAVIPLLLRLVDNDTEELLKVVQSQMDFLENEDMATLEWLMGQEPEKLLWIVDGLDEYQINEASELYKFLKGRFCKKSCCVITTRTEGLSKMDEQWKRNIQVEAVLQGFNQREIEKYTKLYFAENEEKCQGFLKRILPPENKELHLTDQQEEKELELFQMAKTPGTLEILCLLWEEREEISKNIHELLQHYVECLLILAERRMKKSFDEIPDVISRHHGTLMKFGKLAIEREDKQMRTLFSVGELFKTVGSDALIYSFMYKSYPVSRAEKSSAQFTHKVIQEWLAAYYMVHTNEEIVYNTDSDLLSDASLHKFVYYMDKDKIKLLFKNFLHKVYEELDEETLDYYMYLGGAETARAEYFQSILYSLMLWYKIVEVTPEMFQLMNDTEFAKSIRSISGNFSMEGHGKLFGYLIKACTLCKTVILPELATREFNDMVSITKGNNFQVCKFSNSRFVFTMHFSLPLVLCCYFFF